MSVKSDIAAELRALERDGLLKPEDVHVWADANRESAVAQRLEWNNRRAGYQYRLTQIRTLIRIYIVDVTGEPVTVSLSLDRAEPGGGYRNLPTVKATPNLRQVLLEDLLHELERMADRHYDIVELEPVWSAVRGVRRSLTPKRAVTDPRAGVSLET
jgi:hypothetical protein